MSAGSQSMIHSLLNRQQWTSIISSVSFRLQAEADVGHLSHEPLDLNAFVQQAHHPEAGGVVLFSGEARNIHNGKTVKYLEYEAHETMAETMIAEIVQTAVERWKLIHASAVHRTGIVNISESAVVVVTSHAHRRQAYEANQFIIDRIKKDVPIWKCEHYNDGTHEWGNNPVEVQE